MRGLGFLTASSLLGEVAIAQETAPPDTEVAGNEQVAEIMRTYEGRGTLADDTPPTPAEEAVKQFRVRDGFEIELMASEPEVTQPLFGTWDSRGRFWVVQYRQYQFPAGLKIVRYDQHLRAVFDRVPEPPPEGVPGADKITVFEDTDGDGRFDRNRDVIEGLNIATSVQIGHRGIWVLNPPYLLFYPDEDRDDVPDGDPEVRLSGFGLEDTHSVANSLRWGPDGWLYGASGSTTTGEVSSSVTKNVEFQGQCIWRYHPDTEIFEIYAEGGGNTFSLEIDAKGRVFSGTNNGNTRGMHYPQGSFGKKSWGKHGPLTNPYAFGFFQHMRHEGDERRFAQAFCIYEGGLYPESYDGAIVAPNSLQNVVWLSRRLRDTSTYRTVDQENLVESPDRWFRPVWCGLGPDGCVYLADWYDTRLSHVRPVDDWHKTSGRIYRIRPEGTAPRYGEGDLREKSMRELIGLFDHRNRWVRQRAVLETREREAGGDLIARLVQQVERDESLEALWALNLQGELTSERAERWLRHRNEHIRRWVVRLLGDRREGSAALVELARTETAVQVRSQLASTAKRLPPRWGVPLVGRLLRHSEDVEDRHLPLLNWWALEAHAESGRERVLELFRNPEIWSLPMVREHIASRLMQRYAMAGGRENLETAALLLELAPDEDVRGELFTGLLRAFEGRTMPELPESLDRALEEYETERSGSSLVIELRRGEEGALDEALESLQASEKGLAERIELVKVLGETGNPAVVGPLLKLVRDDSEHALQRVAMRALARFDDERVARTILRVYNSRISAEHDVRGTANRVLASRPSWARAFLEEIDRWHIRAEEIGPDVVQQLRTYREPALASLVEEHFGQPEEVSSPDKLAEMARIREVLAAGTGHPGPGRELFQQRCAVCHRLFGEGGIIGPDLTGYERQSLDFWLPGILDPSLEIREGYETYLVKMKDGRAVTGMMAEQGPDLVRLGDVAGNVAALPREDIAELRALPVSLMPEGLLAGLSDEQLRDLFAYLSLAAKPGAAGKAK